MGRIFHLLFLAIFVFTGYNCLAGSGGNYKIRGRVTDSATGNAIDYATITVLRKGDTTVAGGMITDESGRFTIDSLDPGRYLVKVDFIGFVTKTITASFDTGNYLLDLGDIPIGSGAKKLGEVTVTGSHSFMENHIDKFVYNVEKDVSSEGGVATDVLRKVPQVSVDVDGKVELLGSGNIRVFINGRPSTMFDNNLAEALQSIPASQIKSIEVITSPGAQYDAQGTGGIINIILRENKSQQVNGSITLSAGTRLENGAANIHAKKGTVDINASLSGNAQLKGTTLNSLYRTTDSADIVTGRLSQNGDGTLEKKGYRGQLGIDWAISKKDNLIASVSYNHIGEINGSSVSQQSIGYFPATADSLIRNSDNDFKYDATDLNISYLRKFNTEGRELNLTCQSGYGYGSTRFQQAQNDITAFMLGGATGSNNLKNNESYISADYTHPFTKDVVLATGTKGTFTHINIYSDRYLMDSTGPAQQDNFTLSRNIYAGYVSLTFQPLKNYSVKAGIRDEYTDINIPSDSGRISPSYNSFIPSIVVSRKLNDNQNIKATWYRRIQRAGYRELNPFLDATDPSSLVQGNPYLKPERTNAAELTYFRSFDKGNSVLISLFYRNTQDDQQRYLLHADSVVSGKTVYRNVTITTSENAGTQQISGIFISGTLALAQKLELRGNIRAFYKYIVSGIVPGNTLSAYNYHANINASYQLSNTLIAEFFGSFHSARTEIQGSFPSFTSYSIAIRKQFLKKKASIAFTTTNPFNEYTGQRTDVAGEGFTLVSNRRIPYRSFGLSISYKFGSAESKEKKPERTTGDDEGN